MCNICWFQGIKHGMFSGKEREYVSRLEDVIFYLGYHRLGWVGLVYDMEEVEMELISYLVS